jgi:ATP-dependent helicase HrpB
MLGLREGPVLADGRVPLVLHLLSPAGRPLQLTTDLAAFWAGAYVEVKKEMRGRYPKHYWPDNPAASQATRFTKRRMNKDS